MTILNALITCRNVSKVYTDNRGEQVPALDHISLQITPGEFLVMVGSSGCGKTTLLNILAGFEQPTTGQVFLENMPIKAPGVDRGHPGWCRKASSSWSPGAAGARAHSPRARRSPHT